MRRWACLIDQAAREAFHAFVVSRRFPGTNDAGVTTGSEDGNVAPTTNHSARSGKIP